VKSVIFERLKTVVQALLAGSDEWRGLRRCDILFVAHDGDFGQIEENKYYSPILDPLYSIYRSSGYDVLNVMKPFSKKSSNRLWSKGLRFNWSFLLAKICTRLGIGRIYNEERVWRRILSICEPRLVIGIQPSAELCRVCKEVKITIYDVQHGVIESSARKYSRLIESSPKFLVWDERSANVLRAYGFGEKDVTVIGHPFHFRYHKKMFLPEKVMDFRSFPIGRGDRKTILITLQYDLQHFYGTTFEYLPSSLEKFIHRHYDRYDFMIRMHPLKREKQLKYLKKSYRSDMIDYEECSIAPLPLVLERADIHITYHSSTTIEASWYGVPTILLSPAEHRMLDGKDALEYEIRRGVAVEIDPMGEGFDDKLEDFIGKEHDLPKIFDQIDTRERILELLNE